MNGQPGRKDSTNGDFLGAPHNKPYMTSRVGRQLERASYRDLVLIFGLAVLFLATYFTFAPPTQGLPQSEDFLNRVGQALYFTVVTATSLGYGDLSPHGFGRVVACATVLLGLTVVTLLVGKVASERTLATLFLLHTSDRERRLQAFCQDISIARQRLENSILDLSRQDARRASKDMATILEIASNYISFHAYHSNLGDYGNAPALYRFLLELRSNLRPIFAAMSSSAPDLPSYERLERLLHRMERTFKTIISMQSSRQLDWTDTALVWAGLKGAPTVQPSKGQLKLYGSFTQELATGRAKLAQHLTVDKLIRVLAACPKGPVIAWQKGIHKEVALACGVSNNIAAKCIKQLLQQGYLPK